MSRAGPRRTAVVLFNLGGPDSLKAVRPFLYRLFSDKAIIGLPAPFRQLLAWLISTLRDKSAQANYALMGGASPLRRETEAQSAALQAALAARLPDREIKTVVAMRYWKPFTEEAAAATKAFDPDEIVLLPLYPQYSTTTSASSLEAWRKRYRGRGEVRAICCFPDLDGLAEAHAKHIRQVFDAAGQPANIRLLFSAHGLPQKVIDAGDPYQWQVERTCAAVMGRLGEGWDWGVCYQSRVGPLKWLGPSTIEAIEAAAAEGKGVLVVPVAFVSEHVETLVELDHEYGALAKDKGCPHYLRAPALGVAVDFIDGLAGAVTEALARPPKLESACGGRICPAGLSACPAKGNR
jgi:protoporphyrin/coproporphyrin ferrochelatase